MKSRFYITISVMLIIFIAGCVDPKTETDIISKDLLVIKEPIEIYPSKNLKPDDNLIIRMNVENIGQIAAYLLVDTDTKNQKENDFDGDYLLIDHCETLYRLTENMNVISRGACVENLPDTVPPIKGYDGDTIHTPENACYIKIPKDHTQTFEWKIKAPSEEAMLKMTNKCDFKFQIAYAARAQTNTYVYFADPLEVAQRLYTKKDMTLSGDNIAAYGPVAINFETAEPQPISAKKDGDWTVYLNIKNVGKGIADIIDLNMVLPKEIKKANCIVIGGVNEKIKLIQILEKVVEPPETLTIRGALQAYHIKCDDDVREDCSEDSKKLVEKYDELCMTRYDIPGAIYEEAFCGSKFLDVSEILNNAKDRLKIYSDESSRIICELKNPEGVAIITPFHFITAADYIYRETKEISIKTTPFR